MTQLTPAQKELVKVRPQISKLNLVLFEPRVIFQAQINDGSITKGARTITYNNVTLGNFSAIEANFTLLVGTTAGAQDVGRIRIRSATSTQIVVSENSNINWANALHLTVLRYVELWPVFPRIIQDPANVENVIFYKDYDIVYTNQNSILGTFVNAGPHQPVLINNLTGTAYYSSTGTYNLLNHSLTYNWSFEGGTPTGSTAANPGNVYYSTPGNYVTRLIVTDATNGAVDTTYRYVAVRNQIGEGSNTPIVRWTMGELNSSRTEGGHNVEFILYDTIAINDNAVVMLVSDDWYGSTHQSIGGNYPNAAHIFFVGHIQKDSIHIDYEYSFVKFNAISISELMKQSLGFSVSVESKSAPTKWFELLDMDCRRAIYHYLRWHSTVLNFNSVEFRGTDYPIQYFDSDRGSMFDAVDNLMRGTLLGQITTDRQGKLWAEVNAMAYPNPTGSFPSMYDISKRDWLGRPTITESFMDDYSYLEYGGIAYSGVGTGTFTPLIGCAPGAAPAFRGKIEKQQGLALLGQAQLNQMVGNVLANKNSRFPTIEMQMTENLRNIDIAPQESNRIIITPDDTVRDISLDRLYQPESLTWKYDPQAAFLLPRIIYRNVVTGLAGDSIIIPATPDDGGFEVPGIRIPNIPPFNPAITNNIIGAIKFGETSQIGVAGNARLLLGSPGSFSYGDVFSYITLSGTFASNLTATRAGIYYVHVAQHFEGTTAGAIPFYFNPKILIAGSHTETAESKQYVSDGSPPHAIENWTEVSDIFYLAAGDTVTPYYETNNAFGTAPIGVIMSAMLLFAI